MPFYLTVSVDDLTMSLTCYMIADRLVLNKNAKVLLLEARYRLGAMGQLQGNGEIGWTQQYILVRVIV